MITLILLNSIVLLFLISLCLLSMFLQFTNSYLMIFTQQEKQWKIGIEVLLSFFTFYINVQMIFLLNETKRGNIPSYFLERKYEEIIVCIVILSVYGVGARAILLLINKLHFIRNSVNGLTIKHVMDTLEDGIMFVNEMKQRVFTNDAMYEICERIFGKNYQIKSDLWKEITDIEENRVFDKRTMEDKLLFRFVDRTYEFSKEEIEIGKKRYIRYVALDVTKRDITLQKLEMQTDELSAATENLIWMLENLEQIKKEEEIGRMMRKLHDVCAQRVSIIRQTMLSKKEIDYVYLESMLDDFSEEMAHGLIEKPIERLQDIQNSFKNIGMKIVVHGEIPIEKHVQNILCEIFRESATNALRHANAKKIDVYVKEMGKGTKIEIYNDGIEPKTEIIEGNGINGMRENLRAIQGTLEIIRKPKFKILIFLYKEKMK